MVERCNFRPIAGGMAVNDASACLCDSDGTEQGSHHGVATAPSIAVVADLLVAEPYLAHLLGAYPRRCAHGRGGPRTQPAAPTSYRHFTIFTPSHSAPRAARTRSSPPGTRSLAVARRETARRRRGRSARAPTG